MSVTATSWSVKFALKISDGTVLMPFFSPSAKHALVVLLGQTRYLLKKALSISRYPLPAKTTGWRYSIQFFYVSSCAKLTRHANRLFWATLLPNKTTSTLLVLYVLIKRISYSTCTDMWQALQLCWKLSIFLEFLGPCRVWLRLCLDRFGVIDDKWSLLHDAKDQLCLLSSDWADMILSTRKHALTGV